jgi:hypothetical protein
VRHENASQPAHRWEQREAVAQQLLEAPPLRFPRKAVVLDFHDTVRFSVPQQVKFKTDVVESAAKLFRQIKAFLTSYTRTADFIVRLTVDGPDDAPYEQSLSIGVTGELKPTPDLRANRRFEQAADK